MNASILAALAIFAVALYLARRLQIRLRLSRAKHPSIAGHAKISKRLARLLPFYEYTAETAFASDGAASEVVAKRRQAFDQLADSLAAAAPKTIAASNALEPHLSDMQFTNAYRVPFQYRRLAAERFPPGALAVATDGVKIQNLDGNWSYDVGGSYGVNLLGYDFYKGCIERAAERVRDLGPVLGPYHQIIAENVRLLREISGLDQVSFHMSGTEAVMQAVALARYHTGKTHLVQFTGAYHGWWDGVQPGVGGQRRTSDVYLLEDMSEATLKVLRTRKDIACVLVNPLQALHPNRSATNDAMLIASDRSAGFDREGYQAWLQALRRICTKRGIVLLFDEVFVGFRLGLGGAQEYFGVKADMVTYGKSLGGGLPVGVVCGKAHLMRRYKANNPADICFARGTFNSHPYVLAAMNEFLRYATSAEFARDIALADGLWSARAANLNDRFQEAGVPIRVHNLSSIWILTYEQPGRYNWMLQYYLRAEGLALAWVGTGRFIFSHNYTDADFEAVADRFVSAATRMRADGWWSAPEALSNGAIKKQVFRETLASRFFPRAAN
ncbi:MAG: aminotransferase class III-fold pyridoxal phosphate-dependent enzyme [Pseudomonadota bacterium]